MKTYKQFKIEQFKQSINIGSYIEYPFYSGKLSDWLKYIADFIANHGEQTVLSYWADEGGGFNAEYDSFRLESDREFEVRCRESYCTYRVELAEELEDLASSKAAKQSEISELKERLLQLGVRV